MAKKLTKYEEKWAEMVGNRFGWLYAYWWRNQSSADRKEIMDALIAKHVSGSYSSDKRVYLVFDLGSVHTED